MTTADARLTGSRRVRVVASLIGAAFGFAVVVQSLLPGGPYLPDGVEFIPFVMVFPLFGWAVIERSRDQAARRKGQPRRKWYERRVITTEDANRGWADIWATAHRYRVSLAIAVPVVLLMWILMMFSIVTLQGQPVHAGKQYYLNNHGSHIPVSKTAYDHAIAKQQCGFSAAATAFLTIALGMTLTYDPRKRVSSRSA